MLRPRVLHSSADLHTGRKLVKKAQELIMNYTKENLFNGAPTPGRRVQKKQQTAGGCKPNQKKPHKPPRGTPEKGTSQGGFPKQKTFPPKEHHCAGEDGQNGGGGGGMVPTGCNKKRFRLQKALRTAMSSIVLRKAAPIQGKGVMATTQSGQ